MKNADHRWAIDSIEENSASVEVDGKTMVSFPRWLLPREAKEGDVLSVMHTLSPDGAASTLNIAIDTGATKAAKEASVRAPRKTGKEKIDPGGDIRF